MMDFLIYDDAGSILRCGSCPEAMVDLQAQPGEHMLPTSATGDRHYVAGGEVRAFTDQEFFAKTNLPAGWVWTMPGRIAVDARSVGDAKSAAWERVKAARHAVEHGGFTFDGGRYDSDVRSAQRITAASQSALAQVRGAAAASYSVNWILADNTIRTLDGAGIIGLATALAAHANAAFTVSSALREQIAAATTVEQLDAIQWPAPQASA